MQDEGMTYQHLVLYGALAAIGGALMVTLNPIFAIFVFLGVPILVIGLLWMACAPKKSFGETRLKEQFWKDMVTHYELGGKKGLEIYLRTERDNLQAKGARRALRSAISSQSSSSNRIKLMLEADKLDALPHLKEMLEAVEAYCNNPENPNWDKT